MTSYYARLSNVRIVSKLFSYVPTKCDSIIITAQAVTSEDLRHEIYWTII